MKWLARVRREPVWTTAVFVALVISVAAAPRRAAATDSPPDWLTGRIEAHATITSDSGGSEGFDVHFEGRLVNSNGTFWYRPGTVPSDGPGQIQASGWNNGHSIFDGAGTIIEANWKFAYDDDPGHERWSYKPDEVAIGPIGDDGTPPDLHMFIPLTVSGTNTYYDPRGGTSTEDEPWDSWVLKVDNPAPRYVFNDSSFAAAPLTVTARRQASGLYVLTVSGSGSQPGQRPGEIIQWSVSGLFSDNDAFVQVVPDPPFVGLPARGQGKLSAPVTYTAYTNPPDAPVRWSGDLGVKPVIQGHRLTTRYDKPGFARVTASLAGSRGPVLAGSWAGGISASDVTLQARTAPVTSASTQEPVVRVTFSRQHLRRRNAPADLPDGIPPGPSNATTLRVTVSPENAPVILRVMNSGAAGSATLDGSPILSLRKTTDVQVAGGKQTDIGKLTIAAFLEGQTQGAAPLAQTEPFSVCAHPSSVHFGFETSIQGLDHWPPGQGADGAWWGAVYSINNGKGDIESDSGQAKDLDRAMVAEKLSYSKEVGYYKGRTHEPSGFVKAVGGHSDLVGIGSLAGWQDSTGQLAGLKIDLRKSPSGEQTVDQHFQYYCTRCGMSEREALPVPKSGFVHHQTLARTGADTYELKVYKKAKKQDGVEPGVVNDPAEKTIPVPGS